MLLLPLKPVLLEETKTLLQKLVTSGGINVKLDTQCIRDASHTVPAAVSFSVGRHSSVITTSSVVSTHSTPLLLSDMSADTVEG